MTKILRDVGSHVKNVMTKVLCGIAIEDAADRMWNIYEERTIQNKRSVYAKYFVRVEKLKDPNVSAYLASLNMPHTYIMDPIDDVTLLATTVGLEFVNARIDLSNIQKVPDEELLELFQKAVMEREPRRQVSVADLKELKLQIEPICMGMKRHAIELASLLPADDDENRSQLRESLKGTYSHGQHTHAN